MKKIAIHHTPGSFSDKWIEYCKENNIPYKIVNAYSNDIINELNDIDIFMWHFHHNDNKAKIFAKDLIFALEKRGVKVFPNINTCMSFDNKIAQKYLLEAINAPLVNSYVFYDKDEAIEWARKTTYPKVFKLKGGAGSSNVILLNSYNEAEKLINKMFSKGMRYNRFNSLREGIWKFKKEKNIEGVKSLLKGAIRVFIPNKIFLQLPVEKNYFYVQEFIPNNSFDIRVIVIGNKAFAIKRVVRENDFRASGSGKVIYDKNEIPIECIKLSFEINKKINSQCIAFDYIFDEKHNPLIVEISYGFIPSVYIDCPGFWDDKLNWYEGKFTPEYFMIEDLING